jgi:hypothetical protein
MVSAVGQGARWDGICEENVSPFASLSKEICVEPRYSGHDFLSVNYGR